MFYGWAFYLRDAKIITHRPSIPDCIFGLFVRIVKRGLFLATRFEQKLRALRAFAVQPNPSKAGQTAKTARNAKEFLFFIFYRRPFHLRHQKIFAHRSSIPACIFGLFVRIVKRDLFLATRFVQTLAPLAPLAVQIKAAQPPRRQERQELLIFSCSIGGPSISDIKKYLPIVLPSPPVISALCANREARSFPRYPIRSNPRVLRAFAVPIPEPPSRKEREESFFWLLGCPFQSLQIQRDITGLYRPGRKNAMAFHDSIW
jgi:hypothetical protein